MTWTQAICVSCWNQREPDRPVPADLATDEGPLEQCSYCGAETRCGIYVRDDPAAVPYPRVEEA